ncbi:TonB-dependent siderophore receptor [Pseudomonas sp. CMR5c]|nr:TonB-dependent siderophore receptor [Pseudomonas sp. CMR5c]
MPHLPLTPRSRLSLAVQRVLFAGLLSGGLLFAIPKTPACASEQTRSYAIPAGNLDQALNRFASENGILLSVDAQLTAGKRSPGLDGSYPVAEGLSHLLAGTGLRATNRGGNYAVEVAPDNAGALQLKTTTVTGAGLGATTEGTGSYTTGQTNTATKLDLSLRETPQSVSVMTKQRMQDQNLRSIGQVLEQTPGLNVQSPGSDRLYVYSRGLPIDNFQYDGVPTTSFAFSQAMPHALSDMAIYDRIEVVRGATGLMSGAGDPSGTVNMVRKKPTSTFQGHVSAGLGSWDLYRTEVDVSGPLTDNGAVRGRAVAAYQQGNSFTDHLQQEKTILYGVTEMDLSPTPCSPWASSTSTMTNAVFPPPACPWSAASVAMVSSTTCRAHTTAPAATAATARSRSTPSPRSSRSLPVTGPSRWPPTTCTAHVTTTRSSSAPPPASSILQPAAA